MTSSKNNVCPKIHGPLQHILPFHSIFFSVKLKKKRGVWGSYFPELKISTDAWLSQQLKYICFSFDSITLKTDLFR